MFKSIFNFIQFLIFIAKGGRISAEAFSAEIQKVLAEENHTEGWQVMVVTSPYDLVGFGASRTQLFNASLYAGFTVPAEVGGQDTVVFCLHVFKVGWFGFASTWQEAVRQLVRHEFRHVAQIEELRRRGGAQYVQRALEAHTKVSPLWGYQKDPMEADAYANQEYAPADQSDIEAAVDKIVANF